MEDQKQKTEPKEEVPGWTEMLDACLKWDSDKCPDVEKNEWETEFLDSVDKRRKRFGDTYPISEKQIIKLTEIHSKLFP